jgi:excisionase family DNA binding protein
MEVDTPFPEFLTPAEVAAGLRTSTMTIYRHLHNNRISYVRIGRHFRITKSEFDRLLREGVTL